MDPITVGLILGGNLLGSVFASHQSAKANNAVRNDMNEQIREIRGLWNQERYGSPFMRPDVQAMLARTNEGYKDIMKTSRDNAIRTGATTEKQVATGGELAGNYAKTMTGILSQDQRQREWAKNRYQQMMMQLRGQKSQYDIADAQKWPMFMDNLAGLSGAAVEILGS